MLRMQARHQGQPPIIPARDQAVAPTVCDECGEQMWASIISRRDICSVCRAKEETTRSTILGQIMDRFS
jgi:hypothetical protein